MAAAAGGFDLGSLVPELPGVGVINQLLNPWNRMNFASIITSLVNLFLYLRLRRHNIPSAGGTIVDVRVQNVPIIEGRPTTAVELHDPPTIQGQAPLPLIFEVNPIPPLSAWSNQAGCRWRYIIFWIS